MNTPSTPLNSPIHMKVFGGTLARDQQGRYIQIPAVETRQKEVDELLSKISGPQKAIEEASKTVQATRERISTILPGKSLFEYFEAARALQSRIDHPEDEVSNKVLEEKLTTEQELLEAETDRLREHFGKQINVLTETVEPFLPQASIQISTVVNDLIRLKSEQEIDKMDVEAYQAAGLNDSDDIDSSLQENQERNEQSVKAQQALLASLARELGFSSSEELLQAVIPESVRTYLESTEESDASFDIPEVNVNAIQQALGQHLRREGQLLQAKTALEGLLNTRLAEIETRIQAIDREKEALGKTGQQQDERLKQLRKQLSEHRQVLDQCLEQFSQIQTVIKGLAETREELRQHSDAVLRALNPFQVLEISEKNLTEHLEKQVAFRKRLADRVNEILDAKIELARKMDPQRQRRLGTRFDIPTEQINEIKRQLQAISRPESLVQAQSFLRSPREASETNLQVESFRSIFGQLTPLLDQLFHLSKEEMTSPRLGQFGKTLDRVFKSTGREVESLKAELDTTVTASSQWIEDQLKQARETQDLETHQRPYFSQEQEEHVLLALAQVDVVLVEEIILPLVKTLTPSSAHPVLDALQKGKTIQVRCTHLGQTTDFQLSAQLLNADPVSDEEDKENSQSEVRGYAINEKAQIALHELHPETKGLLDTLMSQVNLTRADEAFSHKSELRVQLSIVS